MFFAIHQCESATSAHVSPYPDIPSHLPPHSIPLDCPSAPALSALFYASNLDWWSISHMVIYMFNAILSNHPTLTFSHRVQKSVLSLCVFCSLSYSVIITIFLNSIYMCYIYGFPKSCHTHRHPKTHYWTLHCTPERKRSSSTHQNTDASFLNQETW